MSKKTKKTKHSSSESSQSGEKGADPLYEEWGLFQHNNFVQPLMEGLRNKHNLDLDEKGIYKLIGQSIPKKVADQMWKGKGHCSAKFKNGLRKGGYCNAVIKGRGKYCTRHDATTGGKKGYDKKKKYESSDESDESSEEVPKRKTQTKGKKKLPDSSEDSEPSRKKKPPTKNGKSKRKADSSSEDEPSKGKSKHKAASSSEDEPPKPKAKKEVKSENTLDTEPWGPKDYSLSRDPNTGFVFKVVKEHGKPVPYYIGIAEDKGSLDVRRVRQDDLKKLKIHGAKQYGDPESLKKLNWTDKAAKKDADPSKDDSGESGSEDEPPRKTGDKGKSKKDAEPAKDESASEDTPKPKGKPKKDSPEDKSSKTKLDKSRPKKEDSSESEDAPEVKSDAKDKPKKGAVPKDVSEDETKPKTEAKNTKKDDSNESGSESQ